MSVRDHRAEQRDDRPAPAPRPHTQFEWDRVLLNSGGLVGSAFERREAAERFTADARARLIADMDR